jgi:hypothetical protein
MAPPPPADPGPATAAGRARPGHRPAPAGPPPDRAAWAAATARAPRAASLLAAARVDQRLAGLLLRLPPSERQRAIRGDARFHRLTLARLLALRAESALHHPSSTALEAAQLAAILASQLLGGVDAAAEPAGGTDTGTAAAGAATARAEAVTGRAGATTARANAETGPAPAAADPGKLRDTAATAHWLLGKALLEKRRWRLAGEAFACVFAFARHPGPCEHQALACAGLAQVHAARAEGDPSDGTGTGGNGPLAAATALFLRAAHLFCQLGHPRPAAACLAELGLALHGSADPSNAAHPLRQALRLLGNPRFAPSLAARLRLALAELAAARGEPAEARAHLAAARRLYPVSSAAGEPIERAWREARVAAAGGDAAAADPLFDRARHALLARGSFAEAARCTLDQLLSRLAGGRAGTAGQLIAALAAAFPEAGARRAALIAGFARLERLGQVGRMPQRGGASPPGQDTGGDPSALDLATAEVRRRLAPAAAAAGGRPALLLPARTLADRLLRWRGEHEDMIGAAAGL